MTDVAIWLVKNGADMDIGDMNGDTAMHWAAYKGFVDLVGVLHYLRPQLSVSLDNFGQTPLPPCVATCPWPSTWPATPRRIATSRIGTEPNLLIWR